MAINELLWMLGRPRCLVCSTPLAKTGLCRKCLPPPYIEPPGRCSKCYGALDDYEESETCEPCRIFPLPFRMMRYLWDYRRISQNLITAMKFDPSMKLAKILAKSAGGYFTDSSLKDKWDYIVPLPITRRHFRERLFNQSQIIAGGIEEAIKPNRHLVAPGILRLKREYAPQATLRNRERLKNVKDIFEANSRKVRGQRILLVDDVMTSGATATEAAKTLLRVGAESVDLFTLARARGWHRYRMFLAKRSH